MCLVILLIAPSELQICSCKSATDVGDIWVKINILLLGTLALWDKSVET